MQKNSLYHDESCLKCLYIVNIEKDYTEIFRIINSYAEILEALEN